MKYKDQYKIAFTTKWGIFAFQRMPFGLSNEGDTFQRAMVHAFGELKNKIILVYLDDIIVFSKNGKDHLEYLR